MPRREWRRLAISAAWWLAALPSIATTYYVSPTGDDGNAGTLPTAPLQSINTAIGKAGAGDTIHLIAGSVFVEDVYFAPGSGGTSGSPKTLTTPAADPGMTNCHPARTGRYSSKLAAIATKPITIHGRFPYRPKSRRVDMRTTKATTA